MIQYKFGNRREGGIMKTYYIYTKNDIFIITEHEFNIPPNKVAAKHQISDTMLDNIMKMDWDLYQEMLQYYFEHGQKLVTA
jgi:hypothetical protein